MEESAVTEQDPEVKKVHFWLKNGTLWIIIIKESLKKKESIRTGANFKVGFDGDCQKNGQRDVSVGTSAKVWNWEQDGRCSANRGDRGKMMFFTQMTMMVMLRLTEIATMVKLKNRYLHSSEVEHDHNYQYQAKLSMQKELKELSRARLHNCEFCSNRILHYFPMCVC